MRRLGTRQSPGRLPVASDVAALAGVSTATVSRVLSAAAAVRPDKRAAVLQAAAQLGFVANGAARALSLRQFHTVGAVIPNIENEEFVCALSALQAGLRKGGTPSSSPAPATTSTTSCTRPPA